MRLVLPALVLAATASASAQILPSAAGEFLLPVRSLATPSASLLPAGLTLPGDGSQPLLDFRDSDIKFRLGSLMEILRDHQHEGWVLAAYPDPNTRRPLIGAGFSLDVQATVHPQRDLLNPHPFVEPSAAQLWQAAGLPPERLQQILDQFDRDSNAWTARQYRRKVIRHKLTPQLTEEEGHAPAAHLCHPGGLQRKGLLPGFRSANRVAADGAEPIGIPDGYKSGTIRCISWRLE